MKKIFAILLSFQLIISPLAVAQDIPGTAEVKSGVTNDAYKKTGNGSSGGYDFYVSQIAGIGTGMLGASIITQCLEGLKTPSIATFMAGSLVHIASEILGAKKKNDRNKKKLADIKLKHEDLAKSGDVNQLQSLKDFLVEEEDTYEFLQNRKKWMIAVDVIYVAAVGLAIAEQVYGIASRTSTALTSCTTKSTALATTSCAAAAAAAGPSLGTGSIPAGIAAVAAAYVGGATAGSTVVSTAAVAAAAAASATVYGAAGANIAAAAAAGAAAVPACIAANIAVEIPLCTANSAVVGEGVKAAVVTHAVARSQLKAACAGPYYAECYAAGEAEFALSYAACKQVPVDGGASMFSWSGLLGMAYGFGSGQLNKDGGQVSQYGSMAVSLLSAFVPAVSKVVAQAYNFPIPRSITFGALAVMSGINTAGLAKRETIAMENIVKIKNSISQFKVETEGAEAIELGDTTGNSSATKVRKIKEFKKMVVSKTKSCISNAGGKFDISTKACGKPIRMGRTSFGRISIPVLRNVANLSANMADALAEGDEGKASDIADEIGAMAGRVKQATEELKAKYNADQKSKKLPSVDFDNKIKQEVASLQGALQQAAASKSLSLSSMASGSGVTDEKITEPSDVPVVTTSGTTPVVTLPEVDPLAGMGAVAEELPLDSGPAAKAEQSLDDFESTEQDVSKKSDVSIFKQLSNRYILNYTKMFERKKEPEVVVEETKKN